MAMNRMQRNIDEAVEVLTERPMLAADAERILIAYDIKDEHTESAQPARFAAFLSTMLDRVSVPLEDYDLIAGRSVIRELTDAEEVIYRKYLTDPHNPYHTFIHESGHCSYDWEMVIGHGLPGLIKKARDFMESQADNGRKLFLSPSFMFTKRLGGIFCGTPKPPNAAACSIWQKRCAKPPWKNRQISEPPCSCCGSLL